jgi:hypothetical protein
MWQYDTLLNTWTQKAFFAGGGIEQTVSFTSGNKAYVGTGETSVPMHLHKDFWEYNPATDSWTQLMDFPGVKRFSAAAFSIGQFGYIGTGYDSTYMQHTDFYQYNPAANTWTAKAVVGGIGRSHGVGFAIGSKGYIGTGMSPGFVDDFWEYTPDSTTSVEEISPDDYRDQFTISPNPAKDFINIIFPVNEKEKIEITITDARGRIVLRKAENIQSSIFNIQSLKSGIYFVELNNGKEKAVKKFIKE